SKLSIFFVTFVSLWSDLRFAARPSAVSASIWGLLDFQFLEGLLLAALAWNLLFHLFLGVRKGFRVSHGRLASRHVHELAAAEPGQFAFENVADQGARPAQELVEAEALGCLED